VVKIKRKKEYDIVIQELYKEGMNIRKITRFLNKKVSRELVRQRVISFGLDPKLNNNHIKSSKQYDYKKRQKISRDTKIQMVFDRWNTPTKTFETIDEMISHFKMNNIYLCGVSNNGKRDYNKQIKVERWCY
jgi:IS30 family transposase